MRPQKVDQEQLLDALTDVFRIYGYEGASITRLVAATGLERASLYHRFPGGKDEMVRAVLQRADRWFETTILNSLQGKEPPHIKIKQLVKHLNEFYAKGKKPCLLDSLSFVNDEQGIRAHIEHSFHQWIEALKHVYRESGVPAGESQKRAEEAVAKIQGALVLSRGTGNTKIFQRTLKHLQQEFEPDC